MNELRENAISVAAAQATTAFSSISELLAESEDPQEIVDTLHQLFLVPGAAHALAELVREAGLAVHRTQLPNRQELASQLLTACNGLTLAALDIADLGHAVQASENERYDRPGAATAGSSAFPGMGAGPVVQGTGPPSPPFEVAAHRTAAGYSHR
jgi:predicted small secreted protein